MPGPVDFKTPFLAKQIIAYIGNKRRLLSLIHKALVSCCGGSARGQRFLDLFAGSGVVSRLAKAMDFRVFANDWEDYARILNRAYLEIHESDLPGMFRQYGGLSRLIEALNRLPDPDPEEQYIARHYSPSSFETEGNDFQRERLFYTRENGLILDRLRNRLELLYPEDACAGSPEKSREKTLLLGILLYKAATHTNTSGVFKACHKGFGGHGREALKRILARIELEMPVLINSTFRPEIFQEDAGDFVRNLRISKNRVNIAYLDPPYNQHQYGSNYHLLNTLSRWDKPAINNRLNEAGVLEEKAAIRKDWTDTRSDYCYRDKAGGAFENLLAGLEADYILLSYSTEGILPFEEILAMCSRKGSVRLETGAYTKYPGGKQSSTRSNRNIEMVIIVNTNEKARCESLACAWETVERRKLGLLFNGRYSLRKLGKNFLICEEDQTLRLTLAGRELVIPTRSFFELIPGAGIDTLDRDSLSLLAGKLESSMCRSKEEEIEEILQRTDGGDGDLPFLVRQIPPALRKLAHKKYRHVFHHWLARIRGLAGTHPDLYRLIEKKTQAVEATAEKRFNN